MEKLIKTATILLPALLMATTANAACNIVNGRAYGDCAGVTVNSGRAPFQIIERSRSLSGISEGAQVLNGASLSVSGIANRIIVDQGGTASISGTVGYLMVAGLARVSGQARTILLQEGGHVIVTGIVGRISGNGTALLEEGSVISGRPTEVAREVSY